MSNDPWIWSTNTAIPSETGAGRKVLDEVLGQLESQNWIEHDIFSVRLAMEEALVNAIKHGNGLNSKKRVQVDCKMSTCRLRIQITDEGIGFDPNDVPDPTDPENLDVPNGRGLMLMRSFMSRVEYNKRGNCVVMEKERAPVDSDSPQGNASANPAEPDPS
jgi:serine/threonine-protein kinase RsbW